MLKIFINYESYGFLFMCHLKVFFTQIIMKKKVFITQVMQSSPLRKVNLLFFIFLILNFKLFGQGDGTGLNNSIQISEIEIEFVQIPEPEQKALLISTILNRLKIFPNEHIRRPEIDLAIQRVTAMPEISDVSYDLNLATGFSYKLHLRVTTLKEGLLKESASGLFKKGGNNFPYLYNSQKFKLKLDLGANISTVSGLNTWLNNGEFFTQFSPFGKNYPPNNRFIAFESAFSVGLTAVVKISEKVFIYGNYKLILASTLGRDLFREDNPYSILTENLYGGVVGTVPLSRGNVLNYNLSAGRQPYRIGTGMLLNQIAFNGGDRGGMNVWPRFSGDFVGLAQLRYNNLRLEYFYVDPNEFGGFETNTRLTGINFDYSRPSKFKAGFTYLHVPKSTSIYLFPGNIFENRNKLNAFNLRAELDPKPRTNSLIAKIDLGLQTNSRFPMSAHGIAIELGYLKGSHKNRPSISYRFSHLTGDDPKTERYERWDLLYSGNDIDTWIQGLLMKNILFNTNLQAHRVQGQILVKGFRLTTQYFYFRAAQLNNLPLAINEFADKELAHHVSFFAEKNFKKRFYVRLQSHTLWSLKGINEALPLPVKKPWLGSQVMLKYQL